MLLTDDKLKVLMVEAFEDVELETFENFNMFTENVDLLVEAMDSSLFVSLTEDEEKQGVFKKVTAFLSTAGTWLKSGNNGKIIGGIAAAGALIAVVIGVLKKRAAKGESAVTEAENAEGGSPESLLRKLGGFLSKAAEKVKIKAAYEKVASIAKSAAAKIPAGAAKLKELFARLAAKFSKKAQGAPAVASGASATAALEATELDAINFELDMMLAEAELDEIDSELSVLSEDEEVTEDDELDFDIELTEDETTSEEDELDFEKEFASLEEEVTSEDDTELEELEENKKSSDFDWDF